MDQSEDSEQEQAPDDQEGDAEMEQTARFLASYVKEATGYEPKVITGNADKGIHLSIASDIRNPEGYRLLVSENGIEIAGASNAGIFYGVQTLRKSIPAVAEGMAHRVGSGGTRYRRRPRPIELSGGQKQRVGQSPGPWQRTRLILADEPTGALDSETSRVVMDLFHEMHERYHKTIVLITHNPALAQECQRVLT